MLPTHRQGLGYIGDSHFTGVLRRLRGIDIQIPASLQHVEMLFNIVVLSTSHDWQYTP